MVLDRSNGQRSIVPFRQVVNWLNPGDVLVVNDTKVFKARLFGNRSSGGKVEIFLVKRLEEASGDETWEAFVNPSRRVKVGEEVFFDAKLTALLKTDLGGGKWAVQFASTAKRQKIISRFGHVPLPHYIKRTDQPTDLRRYQTVFADTQKSGAVAAPTAGFHFTPSLVKKIEERGVRVARITLHVGPGTFKPVRTDNIDHHTVDPEWAELSPQVAQHLNDVRASGGRVIAVGTTSVRTLESADIVDGAIQPFARKVDLYIEPGFDFRVVDRLITNFHLPKSSLLILLSALVGRERMLVAYGDAIEQEMRFYSYGDAMLVL